MAKKSEENKIIDIGGIGGDMQGIIAIGDVSDVTITIGGQPVPADKQPTVDEFNQLLAEVQQQIAAIANQQELLAEVDPSAPYTAQGAEQSVKSVAEEVEPEMEAEGAESVQRKLVNARNLLTNILDSAKTVAEKTNEVGESVKPIVETLEPLVEKLGVAALWAGKLWLMS